jgi:hypothetical protein
MASSAAASAAASTSQAVMSRLAIRDADKAKQQAQQAMLALQGSSSSTGFDDPFTLHRARPKTMSFGNPFQTVREQGVRRDKRHGCLPGEHAGGRREQGF